MSEDRAELEAYHWQMSRLSAMEPVLTDYLAEAPTALRAALLSSISEKDVKTEQHERGTRAGHLQAQERAAEQRDILQALSDLRAETAAEVLPMLADGRCKHLELGVETLSWSKDSAVGPELRAWAARKVPMDNRALKRLQANPPRRSSVPADVPYRAIIRALRNHPSAETEGFLILAAHDWDPTFRAASVSCMGWWEPIDHAQVSNHLQKARKDPNVDVRQAARAALARLGERTALQWYRQALSSENPQTVHEAIQSVAAETLTLLWPDLDRLTECEEPEIAHHAAESVERLAEEMEWGRKGL